MMISGILIYEICLQYRELDAKIFFLFNSSHSPDCNKTMNLKLKSVFKDIKEYIAMIYPQTCYV